MVLPETWQLIEEGGRTVFNRATPGIARRSDAGGRIRHSECRRKRTRGLAQKSAREGVFFGC